MTTPAESEDGVAERLSPPATDDGGLTTVSSHATSPASPQPPAPTGEQVSQSHTSQLLSPEDLRTSLMHSRRRSTEMVDGFKEQAQQAAAAAVQEAAAEKSTKLPSYSSLVDGKYNALLEEAGELEETGSLDEAAVLLTKAVVVKPHEPEPYRRRAEIYLKACDFQSAILNYKRVCALLPDEPANFDRLAFLYFFYGQVLFDQGQFPEALESFSRAAEMKPDVVGYHTRSIACLASLSRHGECLALVNKRIEAEGDNPDLFLMRARLHQLFGNWTLCYYDVRDALELHPENGEALQMKQELLTRALDLKGQAVMLTLQHKLKEALSRISQAIDHDPSIPEFHVLRGALYRRTRNFNSAVDDFLLALDKSGHDESCDVFKDAMSQLVLTYNDFAVECFQKHFYEEAISLLNKAVRAEKGEKGLYINRGDCFFHLRNYHFALADYQQALDMDPHDWDIKSRISIIFNEFAIMDYFERRYLEAEKKFSLAIQHNPKIGQYYISRSRVRHLLDYKRGAQEDVMAAMHLDPANEEVFSLVARLFPAKSVQEVRESALFHATVRKLLHAFQQSAPPPPRNPQLRPISGAAAAAGSSALALQLETELAAVLPHSLTPSTIGGTRAPTRATSLRSRSALSSADEQHAGAPEPGMPPPSPGKWSRVQPLTPNTPSAIMPGRVRYRPGRLQLPEARAVALDQLYSKRMYEKKKQLNEDVRSMFRSPPSLHKETLRLAAVSKRSYGNWENGRPPAAACR